MPAVEVMLATARIRELILEKVTPRSITEQIAQGVDSYGMQTFDQSLMGLLRNGYITYEEALVQCSNPDDFALRVSGIASSSNDSQWSNFEANKEAVEGESDDFNLEEFDIERF